MPQEPAQPVAGPGPPDQERAEEARALPDPRPGLLRRAEQLRARSLGLREQVATVAEAVATVEEEIARVHRTLADQGGPLAEQASDHANRAEALAAKERSEVERLRTPG